MTYRPLVSIITPAYNGERFLRRTIESVLAQRYDNWEQIIVDDGSTDSTAAIAQQYAAADPRIRYFYQPNQRQAAARNRGLAEARGELVAFLDQDDLWLPEKLEVSVGEFANGGQDLLFTDIYLFERDEQTGRPEEMTYQSCVPGVYQGEEGWQRILTRNTIYVLSVVARREALLAVGGFRNLDNIDDFVMWITLLQRGYVLRGIGRALSLYRFHQQAASAHDRRETRRVLAVFREMEKETGNRDIFRQAVPNYLGYFAGSVMTKRRQDMAYLKEQLDYWDIRTPRVRTLIRWRRFIPENSFKRKLRRAFAAG